MNCPSVEDLLAFTEGSIHGPERESIERHIAGCPKCAALVRAEGWLVRAAAAKEPAAGAPSRATHPDEIDLARFVEGALDGAERDALLGHVAACADCRAAVADYVRDLRGLDAEAVPAALIHKGLALARAKTPRGGALLSRIARFFFPQTGGFTAWLRPAAAVAFLLLAFAVIPKMIPNPEQDEGGIRDGHGGGRPVVTLPAEKTLSRADLAGGRVAFAWTALAGSVAYRAVLASDDGTVLLDAKTAETRWAPTLDAARIARTDRIVFWVEASSGGRHATSATRVYDLR